VREGKKREMGYGNEEFEPEEEEEDSIEEEISNNSVVIYITHSKTRY